MYLADSLGSKNVRVNAISAGPIKTLAAAEYQALIKFSKFMKKNHPLRKYYN